MRNRVSGLSEIDLPLMSIEEFRAMLPKSPSKAIEYTDRVKDVLLSETYEPPPVVTVDVTVGTYVKSISFKDQENIVLNFNEGSSREISQGDSFYSIGEHVYNMSDDVRHSVSINPLAHASVRNEMNRYQFPDRVPNSRWIEWIYRYFPDVRKNAPDALYNINDVCGIGTRIEHFRAFITRMFKVLLLKMPVDRKIAVCLVDFTTEYAQLVKGCVAECNGKRASSHIIQLFETEFDLIEFDGYVYYLTNMWVNSSLLDHGLIVDSNWSGRDPDEMLERALGYYSHFITRSSSIILSSYHPILDVYKDYQKGRFESLQYGKYSYRQIPYVPHKPWTMMNLGLKGDDMMVSLSDSSEGEISKLFIARLKTLMMVCAVNVVRNSMLVRHDEASLLTEMKMLTSNIDFSNSQKWGICSLYKSTILLGSKKLSYTDVSMDLMVKGCVLMNKLSPKVDYTRNDLISSGWNDEMINRCLDLSLLTIWKAGKIIKFRKYESPMDRVKGHFSSPQSPEITQSQMVKVNSDGSLTYDHDGFDKEVLLTPLHCLGQTDLKQFPPQDINSYQNEKADRSGGSQEYLNRKRPNNRNFRKPKFARKTEFSKQEEDVQIVEHSKKKNVHIGRPKRKAKYRKKLKKDSTSSSPVPPAVDSGFDPFREPNTITYPHKIVEKGGQAGFISRFDGSFTPIDQLLFSV